MPFRVWITFPYNHVLRKLEKAEGVLTTSATFHTTMFYGNTVGNALSNAGIYAFHTTMFYGNRCWLPDTQILRFSFHTTMFYGNPSSLIAWAVSS